MPRPKNKSYKEFDEEKIPAARNFPTATPITFLMVRLIKKCPSVLRDNRKEN